MAVALSFLASPVFTHGGEAHIVPMDKTLKDWCRCQWDDFASSLP
ncbi:hypothetical protein ACNKHR_28290 [Shigella flexneri]